VQLLQLVCGDALAQPVAELAEGRRVVVQRAAAVVRDRGEFDGEEVLGLARGQELVESGLVVVAPVAARLFPFSMSWPTPSRGDADAFALGRTA